MQTHCYFYFSGFVSLLNFDNDWRSSHELDAQAKVIVIFGRAVEAAGDVMYYGFRTTITRSGTPW